MRPKSLVASLMLLAASLVPAGAFAELRDSILVVKPVYHEKTRELFVELAKEFGDQGDADGQAYFTALAGEHAHGTGWVVVDEDGQNYIITNRHVVIEAETVNMYIERPDGSQQAYLDCPILYVDGGKDLAVCQFPKGAKAFKTGFKMETAAPKDLTEVVAAGFPGFGGQPLWQVSLGNVTNARARIDPAYDYLIQHSAPIDPGNSGGPLLVKDPSAPQGYGVVGVNTSKAVQRESTNFAIPVQDVREVLQRAKAAQKLLGDPVALRAELVRSCTALASELASEHPVDQTVNQFVSYAIVGEQGWSAFEAVARSATEKDQFLSWFLEDPVEAMRTSIYWLFQAEATRQPGAVEFRGIVYADEARIGKQPGIRTDFSFAGRKKEIVWSLEYGQWRISNVELALPAAASAAPAGPAATQPAVAGTAAAGGADVWAHYPRHSALFCFGLVGSGLYYGVEYTGLLFVPSVIGVSAGVGMAEDGSFFVIGGPAVALNDYVVFPLRAGVAAGPPGVTIIASPGLLLRLGYLSIEFDLGFVVPADFLFGVGVGVTF